MLGAKKVMLKTVINKEFSKGINKVSLFDALEIFIDEQYPEKEGYGIYMTHGLKTKILHDLAVDIKLAGGLELWKKQLLLLSTPVLGSLAPKNKKQAKTKDN